MAASSASTRSPTASWRMGSGPRPATCTNAPPGKHLPPPGGLSAWGSMGAGGGGGGGGGGIFRLSQ